MITGTMMEMKGGVIRRRRRGHIALLVGAFMTRAAAALSSPVPKQRQRRCVLRPWHNKEISLGWCLEVIDEDSRKHTVTTYWNDEAGNDGAGTTVQVPTPSSVEALSDSLWPPSFASSILLCSPTFQRNLAATPNILEMGCGLGLTGTTLATKLQQKVNVTLSDINPVPPDAIAFDWRDATPDMPWDCMIGSDIAYYHHLLRPILDTISPHRDAIVVGQANRESQWDLYKMMRDGGYNLRTDEQDAPWDGSDLQMLLYELEMSEWNQDFDVIDGVVPIAALVYRSKDSSTFTVEDAAPWFSEHDYKATDEDDEAIVKSF